MKNLLNNLKKKSDSFFTANESQKEIHTTENLNPTPVRQKLIEEGRIMYLPTTFAVQELVEVLRKWLTNDKQLLVGSFAVGEVQVVQYKAAKGLINTLGLNHAFHLYLLVNNGKLYYNVYRSAWLETVPVEIKSDYEKGNLFSASYLKEIEESISDFLLQKFEKVNLIPQNKYTEELEPRQRIWLQTVLQKDEVVLAFLSISSMKTFAPTVQPPINVLSYFTLITSHRIEIVGFDEVGNAEFTDNLAGYDLQIESEIIGRNIVKIKGYEFIGTLSNSSLYKELEFLDLFEPLPRIAELARLAWLREDKFSYSTAHLLLEYLTSIGENPFHDFSLLFIELSNQTPRDSIAATINDERLTKSLRKILQHEKISDTLLAWKERWKISDIDATALIRLLVDSAENQLELIQILPFHRIVRNEFRKSNKDEIGRSLFEMEFCRHLIASGEKAEAADLLRKLLQELPDESLSDLLPPENIPPTARIAGQFLKVNAIDLLIETQQEGDFPTLTAMAARLQPLSMERLKRLTEVSDGSLRKRTEMLINLLTTNELANMEYPKDETLGFSLLTEDKIEHLQHPASQQEGFLETVQKWVASVKVPDLTIVKTYSERLENETYPAAYQTLNLLRKTFGISNLECFVVRGEKQVGIRSFEGEPPFLLVGSEHLQSTSKHYLQVPEMRFALASEFAHLHFKHSRITSSDVWDGAKEKGLLVLDFLTFLPGIGLAGNALKRVRHLNNVARLLQATEKIAKVAVAGKTVIDAASQVITVYNSHKNKLIENNATQEMLAISRAMQLTADRSGLLLCGNIKAAIRTIFLTSPNYSSIWQEAVEQGLLSLLNKKDSENRFVHLELAIRLAALFSFYLSDEYISLRKSLLEN